MYGPKHTDFSTISCLYSCFYALIPESLTKSDLDFLKVGKTDFRTWTKKECEQLITSIIDLSWSYYRLDGL